MYVFKHMWRLFFSFFLWLFPSFIASINSTWEGCANLSFGQRVLPNVREKQTLHGERKICREHIPSRCPGPWGRRVRTTSRRNPRWGAPSSPPSPAPPVPWPSPSSATMKWGRKDKFRFRYRSRTRSSRLLERSQAHCQMRVEPCRIVPRGSPGRCTCRSLGRRSRLRHSVERLARDTHRGWRRGRRRGRESRHRRRGRPSGWSCGAGGRRVRGGLGRRSPAGGRRPRPWPWLGGASVGEIILSCLCLASCRYSTRVKKASCLWVMMWGVKALNIWFSLNICLE